jgi:hypothetical protein
MSYSRANEKYRKYEELHRQYPQNGVYTRKLDKYRRLTMKLSQSGGKLNNQVKNRNTNNTNNTNTNTNGGSTSEIIAKIHNIIAYSKDAENSKSSKNSKQSGGSKTSKPKGSGTRIKGHRVMSGGNPYGETEFASENQDLIERLRKAREQLNQFKSFDLPKKITEGVQKLNQNIETVTRQKDEAVALVETEREQTNEKIKEATRLKEEALRQKQEVEVEKEKLEQEKQESEREQKKMLDELYLLRARSSASKSTVMANASLAATLKSELSELEAAYKKFVTEIGKDEDNGIDYGDNKDKIKQEIREIGEKTREKILGLRKGIEEANEEIKKETKAKEAAEEKLRDLETKIKEEEDKSRKLQTEIDTANEKIKAFDETITGLKTEYAKKIEDLESIVSEYQSGFAELRSQMPGLFPESTPSTGSDTTPSTGSDTTLVQTMTPAPTSSTEFSLASVPKSSTQIKNLLEQSASTLSSSTSSTSTSTSSSTSDLGATDLGDYASQSTSSNSTSASSSSTSDLAMAAELGDYSTPPAKSIASDADEPGKKKKKKKKKTKSGDSALNPALAQLFGPEKETPDTVFPTTVTQTNPAKNKDKNAVNAGNDVEDEDRPLGGGGFKFGMSYYR